MKRLFILLCSALVCLGLAACKDAVPPPQPDAPDAGAPLETDPGEFGPPLEFDPDLDADAFLEAIRPTAFLLDACEAEAYGAEADFETSYFAAMQEKDGQLVPAKLYLESEPLPEGFLQDESYASYFPVSNFTTVEQVRENLAQYMVEDVIPCREQLDYNFLEYEGQLYLIRGSMGYGAYSYDLDGLYYLGVDGENQVAAMDYLYFGEYEATIELVFAPTDDGGWLLIETRPGAAG